MPSNVFIVKNEFEAMRYKRKFADILDGSVLLFKDETVAQIRKREIGLVYITESISMVDDILIAAVEKSVCPDFPVVQLSMKEVNYEDRV